MDVYVVQTRLYTEKKNWGLTQERLSRYDSTHFPRNISMAASVDGKARHHGQKARRIRKKRKCHLG